MILNRVRPQNYVLIARNVAYSYEYLKRHFSDKLDTEDLLLVVTGLIAASMYVARRQISLSDLIKALTYAKKRVLFLHGRQKLIYDVGLIGENDQAFIDATLELEKKNDLLLDFTLNIEALELAVDSMTPQIGPIDVLNAVSTAKQKAYDGIEQARRKANSSFPGGIVELSSKVMGSVDFDAVRLAIADASTD